MPDLVIQKAGSASDVVTKNNNRVIYGNILGQEIAAEAGIIARVTRQAGGGGAASSRNVSAIGGTIFTYAERAAVVSNIIANTATNPTNALVLAAAASDIGITLSSPLLPDYRPAIEFLLETNTANTGKTSDSLTATVGVSPTFGTYVGKLSAYFPNSTSVYFTIPFSGVAAASFSISYWFNPIDTLATYYPFAYGTGGAAGATIDINNGTHGFNMRLTLDGSGQTINPAFTFSPASGTWHHATITFNVSNGKFSSYLNGAIKNTVTYTSPMPLQNRQTLTIGRNRAGNVGYNGYMRRFRVYDYELSGDQIASIYYQDSIA